MYPKISIIIPVYNSEKFLSSCLDSILNQSLSEIEIICVDDMSTDNSKHILKQYSLLDDRIKIYSHDKNRGPGAARNTGIKYATGEYLGFIDSDDIPDKNFFKELYQVAIKNNADIAKGLYKNMETGECSELINIKIKGNKNYFFGEFCSAIFLASLVKKN